MKQHEAVIIAMQQIGQLYQTALKIPGSTWETKTPFASIRRMCKHAMSFSKFVLDYGD